MKILWLVLVGLLWCSTAQAQLWSGVVATNRATDWTTAGATIVNRTTNCTTTECNTVWTGTVTSTSLNDAIDSATAGDVVRIPAGSFTLSAGVIINKSNITVRGQGANQTKLFMTGYVATDCSYFVFVCVSNGTQRHYNDDPQYLDGPNLHSVSWTGSYTKGTSVIPTSGSLATLQVGSLLFLDQLDDTTDTGEIWNCEEGPNSCMSEGVVGFSRLNRQGQVHVVTVTAVGTNQITFTPPTHMTYKSARTPQAFWFEDMPVTGVGVEDISIDLVNSGANNLFRAIAFQNATHSWLKGVRMVNQNTASNAPRCLVCPYWSNHITIRDSYFFGDTQPHASSNQHYGNETIVASELLTENNIWEAVTSSLITGQAAQGNVMGYNYGINDVYFCSGSPLYVPCGWMQGSSYHHAIGNNYNLFEGNDGIGYIADAIHGPSYMTTNFRNRYRGWDPDGGNLAGGGKDQQTYAIHIYANNRYNNVIGNVLGEPGLHTDYEEAPATTTDGAGEVFVSIYMLGFSDHQDYGAPVLNDLKVKSTLFRWGNWDVVSQAVRWCGTSANTGWTTTCSSTSEVPTGDSFYPQTAPGSETLPNSFYLSARPDAWWKVGSTTPAWPPIGSDVTGGDMTAQSLGGHVNKIPARLCYESMADDPAYSGTTVRIFNASTCYTAATGDPPPAAPTGVTVSQLHGMR